jgi:hypothetical protein
MSSQHTTFNTSYLREQFKIISEKVGKPEAGKYYNNFIHSPEQHALFLLLLSERIKEQEQGEKVKPKEPEY